MSRESKKSPIKAVLLDVSRTLRSISRENQDNLSVPIQDTDKGVERNDAGGLFSTLTGGFETVKRLNEMRQQGIIIALATGDGLSVGREDTHETIQQLLKNYKFDFCQSGCQGGCTKECLSNWYFTFEGTAAFHDGNKADLLTRFCRTYQIDDVDKETVVLIDDSSVNITNVQNAGFLGLLVREENPESLVAALDTVLTGHALEKGKKSAIAEDIFSLLNIDKTQPPKSGATLSIFTELSRMQILAISEPLHATITQILKGPTRRLHKDIDVFWNDCSDKERQLILEKVLEFSASEIENAAKEFKDQLIHDHEKIAQLIGQDRLTEKDITVAMHTPENANKALSDELYLRFPSAPRDAWSNKLSESERNDCRNRHRLSIPAIWLQYFKDPNYQSMLINQAAIKINELRKIGAIAPDEIKELVVQELLSKNSLVLWRAFYIFNEAEKQLTKPDEAMCKQPSHAVPASFFQPIVAGGAKSIWTTFSLEKINSISESLYCKIIQKEKNWDDLSANVRIKVLDTMRSELDDSEKQLPLFQSLLTLEKLTPDVISIDALIGPPEDKINFKAWLHEQSLSWGKLSSQDRQTWLIKFKESESDKGKTAPALKFPNLAELSTPTVPPKPKQSTR